MVMLTNARIGVGCYRRQKCVLGATLVRRGGEHRRELKFDIVSWKGIGLSTNILPSENEIHHTRFLADIPSRGPKKMKNA